MAVDRKKIVGYSLLWLLLLVVVLWADSVARERRAHQPITAVEITVSGGRETLVDAESIDNWLVLHNIHPEGVMMSNVNLATLESVIASHSAVVSVNAYMTYDGELFIDVVQRRAVARLRIAGSDMYVGSDGYLFPVTDCYLQLLPVITGDYEPLFDNHYVGFHGNSASAPLATIDKQLVALEQRRVDLLKERESINAELRKVEKRGVKREMFMSDEEYRGLVETLKEQKVNARRIHAEKDRAIELSLRDIESERLKVSLEADRIRGIVADFDALVAFATYVCDDPFWSAEIVQIVLSGGDANRMQISIVPRSGDFIVDLGFAEDLVAKLGTLRSFYSSTLNNVGWDKFEHISLRYDGQVVCK